jgi:transcriptional regulator with XRE-family HTH domain
MADIRLQCGLTQQGLAEILGCAKITVQKIEQKKLALSEELFRKAEEQLDVSAGWLLENDPSAPSTTPRGGRWSPELFEFRQGVRSFAVERNAAGGARFRVRTGPQPLEGAQEEFIAWKVADVASRVHAMLAGAQGSPSQGILLHRLNWTLRQLAEKFQPDEATLAAYQPDLSRLRSAYDKAAQRIAKEESDALWSKATEK